MMKSQTITTALGPLTVSSLNLKELVQLDELFKKSKDNADKASLSTLMQYLPIIAASVRKVHQDLTLESLENGLTFDDLTPMFNAVLQVSGLTLGEAMPQEKPV
jgi:hypothetical protein